ncbi:MAG: hypothetical protein ACRD1T_25115 [Acidimicrobiia bacterium]
MIEIVESGDGSSRFVTWAGVASAVGGACWVIKGLAILITGDQPPFLFEIAPVFFLVGLWGLRLRLGHRGGRMATVGIAALGLSVLLGIATWFLSVAADDSRTTGSEEEFQPTLLLAFLALLTGLVLLGIVTRRTRALGDRWSNLPLALVVAAPLVTIVGGALEAINERLLEIPLVLYGFGWMGLGYALMRSVRGPSLGT